MLKQVQIRGFSILEAIIAIAVFSIIASAFVSSALTGFGAVTTMDNWSKANVLATNKLEILRNSPWPLINESTVDGKYTVDTAIVTACASAAGHFSDTCVTPDNDAVKAKVKVSWHNDSGEVINLERESYLLRK